MAGVPSPGLYHREAQGSTSGSLLSLHTPAAGTGGWGRALLSPGLEHHLRDTRATPAHGPQLGVLPGECQIDDWPSPPLPKTLMVTRATLC